MKVERAGAADRASFPAHTHQRGEAVLQGLHGQRHAAPDHVSVEVHEQVEVEVFGDTPVEGGEGARVRHPAASAGTRQVSSAPDHYRKRLSQHPPPACQRKSSAQRFILKCVTLRLVFFFSFH